MAQLHALWRLRVKQYTRNLLLIGGLAFVFLLVGDQPAAAQEADPCAGTSSSNASAKVAGYITINGAPAPVGTVVTMHNPAGERVGCRVTDQEGVYGWTYVNGYSDVDEPYMEEGDEVEFRLNGYEATASPVFYWTEDAYVQVDLTVVIPLTELTGSYAMEGRPDHAATLRVNLYEVGAATPSYSFTPTGTSGGEFVVGGMVAGTYEIAVKHANTLQVVETVTLAEGANSFDFGSLPAGDINGDNRVATADVSILATSFNLSAGEEGYDAQADLNGDGEVSTADVSLLASNFNANGEEPSGAQ